MSKIRKDFEGVIYVRAGADVVKLAACDEVPEGAEVGAEHVDGGTEKPEPKPAGDSPAPKKRVTRSTKAATDDSGDEG